MPLEIYFFQKKFNFFQDVEKDCGYIMTPSGKVLDRKTIIKTLEEQLTFSNQKQIEAIKAYNILEICEQNLFNDANYPYFISGQKYLLAPLFHPKPSQAKIHKRGRERNTTPPPTPQKQSFSNHPELPLNYPNKPKKH